MIARLAVSFLVLVTSSASVQAADRDEVLAAEARRIQATIDVDAEVLGRVLGEDLFYAHSNGVVQTKSELIDAIVSRVYEYKAVDVEESKVRIFGDTAVINAVAVFFVAANGVEIKTRLRYVMVYVRRDGGWQMVSYQSTRLARTD